MNNSDFTFSQYSPYTPYTHDNLVFNNVLSKINELIEKTNNIDKYLYKLDLDIKNLQEDCENHRIHNYKKTIETNKVFNSNISKISSEINNLKKINKTRNETGFCLSKIPGAFIKSHVNILEKIIEEESESEKVYNKNFNPKKRKFENYNSGYNFLDKIEYREKKKI